jgi:hypothetical protein
MVLKIGSDHGVVNESVAVAVSEDMENGTSVKEKRRVV